MTRMPQVTAKTWSAFSSPSDSLKTDNQVAI